MALYSKPNLLNVVWSSGGDKVAPDTAKYSTGWLAEIPPRQYFNFIDWKQDQFAAYLNQLGIPEWDNETEYQANKSVIQGSDGVIYQCLVTGVSINPVTDTSSRWRRIAIEDAPVNGLQYVRRNNGWQQIDSTAFAPAVHTHTISQVTGLQNELNNKLNITGQTPTLNSVSGIQMDLVSAANTDNYVRGKVGGVNSWYVGKGGSTNDDIILSSFLHGTSITLTSDRVVSNKNVYVGANPLFHNGNQPTWAQVSGKPENIGVPRGIITLWYGTTANIPAGWFLCNGSNGTPDLRSRFIVGAGSTYGVGATGGSANAIVVSHNHTGTTGANNVGHTHSGTTSAAGNHTHTTQGRANEDIDTGGLAGGGGNVTSTVTTSTAGNHTHTFSTGAQSANHTHAFTTATVGSSGVNANLPPYYALCYIMKS